MSLSGRLRGWATAPVESTLLQVPRALVVSVLALALDVGLYELLVRQLAMPVVAAAIIGYLAGGIVQYVLCSLWVFHASPGNHATGFALFTVLSLGGLGITCAVVYVVHDLAHANEFVAKLAAVALAFTWNFMSRKYLLFRLQPLPRALEESAAAHSA